MSFLLALSQPRPDLEGRATDLPVGVVVAIRSASAVVAVAVVVALPHHFFLAYFFKSLTKRLQSGEGKDKW